MIKNVIYFPPILPSLAVTQTWRQKRFLTIFYLTLCPLGEIFLLRQDKVTNFWPPLSDKQPFRPSRKGIVGTIRRGGNFRYTYWLLLVSLIASLSFLRLVQKVLWRKWAKGPQEHGRSWERDKGAKSKTKMQGGEQWPSPTLSSVNWLNCLFPQCSFYLFAGIVEDSARMRKQLQVKINLLISTRTLFRHLKYGLNTLSWPDISSDQTPRRSYKDEGDGGQSITKI